MAKEIRVKIVGDASGLQQTIGGVSTSFKGLFKAGAIAGLGFKAAEIGVDKLSEGLKLGFERAEQHNAIMAQVTQALKTTGGASNITAAQIDALAKSIQDKTGIDKLQVLSSEKMLLSFQNIRNEAGKGNAIFSRATQVIQDYAARTGKDATAATLLFGKALEDPLKKSAGLARAGIVLTDAQKKVIKGFIDSGDKVKAQSYLLGLLEKRYGGAAQAAGDTLGGKLARLKFRLEDVAESVAQKLLPYFEKFVDWITSEWPKASAVIQRFFNFMKKALEPLRPAFDAIVTLVQDIAGGKWQKLWDDILRVVQKTVVGIVEAIGNIAPLILSKLGNVADKILTGMGLGNVGSSVKRIFDDVLQIIRGAIDVIAGIFTGDWSRVWEGLQNIFGGLVAGIRDVLQGLLQLVADISMRIGAAIWSGIQAGAGALGDLLNTYVVQPIVGALDTAWTTVSGAATTAWQTIIAGLQAVWSTIAGIASAAFSGIETAITSVWTVVQTVTDTVWGAISTSLGTIWNGLQAVASAAFGAVTTAITTAWTVIQLVTSTVWSAIQSLLSTTWDTLKGLASTAWAAISGAITTAWNTVQRVTNAVWQPVYDAVHAAFVWFRDTSSAVWSAVSSAVTTAWSTVSGPLGSFKGILGDVKGFFSWLLDNAKAAWGAVAGAISGFWDAAGGVLDSFRSALSAILGLIQKIIDAWNTVKGLGTLGGGEWPKGVPVPKKHQGGQIRMHGGGEVPVIAQVGEYMLRRAAVASIGTGNLDYMNRTGQIPMGGPQVVEHTTVLRVGEYELGRAVEKIQVRNQRYGGLGPVRTRAGA